MMCKKLPMIHTNTPEVFKAPYHLSIPHSSHFRAQMGTHIGILWLHCHPFICTVCSTEGAASHLPLKVNFMLPLKCRLSPLIFSPFIITHNCCLQIVNLHELAIGPTKADIRSVVEYPVRNRRLALAVIAHHRHPIPLRKRSDVTVPTKTAPGLRKGIWVSTENRGHMEQAEIARHMYRIMDDVSCFMLQGSHQETRVGEIKRLTYSKSDCWTI